MSDLSCPYCHSSNDVCHDDGEHYEEDKTHQMECYECEESFVFTTEITFDYFPRAAICLNDGKHDWKPTHTYPKFMTKMCCRMCDEIRQPTDSEKQKHNIPNFLESEL